MTELRDKRVLITGAARGIGWALAERFAEEGARVVLTDRDEEALAAAARALGVPHTAHPLDVTDIDAARALRERLLAEQQPLDVLVNNAGVVAGGAFLEVPLVEHRRTFEINTLAPVALTHLFLPDLIARPSAHVVNVVSASAFVGLPRGATYAASKWAMLGFSESLRLELMRLGHRHVGVTAVCPSYVATELFEGARAPRGTRKLTPAEVAELTVRAVRANRPTMTAPWLVSTTPLLRALLPRRWFDAIAGRLGVYSSMDEWRGRS